MAEAYPQGHGSDIASTRLALETRDGSMFDCFGKKEEKPGEDAFMTDQPDDMKREKHTLMGELHRSHSNSSSSSDEEEGGEKKPKKKKGLKEKIKERMSSDKAEEVAELKDTHVSTEICDQVGIEAGAHQEEKKGFLEKIKEKLPGQHKKAEEGVLAVQHECAAEDNSPGAEAKDKKGILEKIKEKLPGYHKNDEQHHDMKDKDKEN